MHATIWHPICTTIVSLLGMGTHGKRVCHTFKLLKRGSFNVPSHKSKKSKGTGNPADPTQTDPINLKAMSKQYHNPDPIACLVGNVNEAHILIDDV